MQTASHCQTRIKVRELREYTQPDARWPDLFIKSLLHRGKLRPTGNLGGYLRLRSV